jgi:hypothetical protein
MRFEISYLKSSRKGSPQWIHLSAGSVSFDFTKGNTVSQEPADGSGSHNKTGPSIFDGPCEVEWVFLLAVLRLPSAGLVVRKKTVEAVMLRSLTAGSLLFSALAGHGHRC